MNNQGSLFPDDLGSDNLGEPIVRDEEENGGSEEMSHMKSQGREGGTDNGESGEDEEAEEDDGIGSDFDASESEHEADNTMDDPTFAEHPTTACVAIDTSAIDITRFVIMNTLISPSALLTLAAARQPLSQYQPPKAVSSMYYSMFEVLRNAICELNKQCGKLALMS